MIFGGVDDDDYCVINYFNDYYDDQEYDGWEVLFGF